MKFLYLFPLFFICALSFPHNFSFNVFNDFHINSLYDPNSPPSQYCNRPFSSRPSLPSLLTNYSSFGRFRCDPPYKLFQVMLEKMKSKSQFSMPEFLLLPGDFVIHGLSQDVNGEFSQIIYELQKEILKGSFEQIRLFFPDTYLFPALGNNDVKFHYQVPKLKEKTEFYSNLFNEWFEKTPKNKQLGNFQEIKRDFLSGGYYKADVSDELSVIILNTLYYGPRNNINNDPITGEIQLLWLEKQLRSIEETGRKTILSYHMFPALYYFTEIQYMLDKDFNQRLQDLFYRYKDSIIIHVAGHIHTNGFLVSHSETEETFSNTIISGAISPVYLNNPSFLQIDVDKMIPKRAIYTYFNFNDFLKYPSYEEVDQETIESFFWEYDLNQEYNLVDLKGDSMDYLIKDLDNNEDDLRKFIVNIFGYEYTKENKDFVLDIYLQRGNLFKNNATWEFDELEKRKYLCTLAENNQDRFNQCVKKEKKMD